MSKPTIYKPLQLRDNFNVAFPDKRIPNGFIDKTKTRVGITYTAFHENRHTLIILPPVAVIEDAIAEYDKLNLFPVYEKVTVKKIEAYLLSDATYKKIVCTPEGFAKVITAARNIKKLPWLFNRVFLYMDEVHCYATDIFRDDILTPFDNDLVFKFKNRAFGSATPFKFSDPRIAKEQHYKITYDVPFGTVTIVHDSNPKAVLIHMLTHPEIFPGPVFIWYNTVTQTGDVIRAAELVDSEDINVFCRADEKNMVNLEDCRKHFKPRPITGEYKKFNFFSRRYDEGWNLVTDETATIVLVTDVHTPHSLIGIPFQGFQAVGRLKTPAHRIFHVTNNYGKPKMRDFETVQRKCMYNAEKQVDYYNQHRIDCLSDSLENDGKLEQLIKPFAKFKDGVAEIYTYKHDQLICDEFCKEHYSNRKSIKDTWQGMNYLTKTKGFDLSPITRTKRTKEQINKEVIERYLHFRDHPSEYVYEVASATVLKYKAEFSLLFEALELLGENEIKRLKYNDIAMKEALINKSNNNAEAKLRIKLIEMFKLNHRYTKKQIKEQLQQLYNELGLRKLNGCIKPAFATDLEKFGLFKVHPYKEDGENGFEIIKVYFTLKVAA